MHTKRPSIHLNKRRILDIARNREMVSRAEIVRITGLSMPTVTKITDQFIELGLLSECGKGESSGGKPPTMLRFVADAYCCVGIDVGSTSITGILADCAGNIRHKCAMRTVSGDADAFYAQLGDMVAGIFAGGGVPTERILGIGIGMPGLIDSKTDAVVFSPTLFFEDIDPRGYLAERFHMPVVIHNMSHAMAVGEHCYGVCRNVENFLCLNVGYGIGSAVFFEGRLYKGHTGFSGEMGHIIVNPLGPQCLCGNRGCLEAVSSGRAIVRDIREQINTREYSRVLELAGGNMDDINAKYVFDAARLGDSVAGGVIANAVRYLGMGIASITNMLDPEVVVFEGGVSRNGDDFILPVIEAWKKHRMRHSGTKTRLIVSDFGENAAAIGASALVFDLLMQLGCNPARMKQHA